MQKGKLNINVNIISVGFIMKGTSTTLEQRLCFISHFKTKLFSNNTILKKL